MYNFTMLACIGGLFSSISLALGLKNKNKLATRLGALGLILFAGSIILDIYLTWRHGL
jgi:hypothetical protein